MRETLIELLMPANLLLYMFAYGFAAIPTSYLVARYIHKVNLGRERAHSHTASYIFKTMSKWSGLLVFCFDVIKGLLPCAIALSLDAPLVVIALVGFFAVLGHCFSIWLRFFGGYGGAPAAGALLILYWPAGLLVMALNSLFLIFGLSPGASSLLATLLGGFALFLGLANKLVLLIVLAMAAVIAARRKIRVF